MNNKLEYTQFDKIYKRNTIGYPFTPGSWCSEPEYKTVTCISMSGSLGYTGQRGMEILEQVTVAELQEAISKNKFVKAITYDNRLVILNTRYMVKAEDFTMVTRKYNSKNPSYLGTYTCRWLLPINTKVTWINEYISK